MHPVNFFEVFMYALVDRRIGDSSLSALKSSGFEPILMPPAEYLAASVASHTDMLMFIGFGSLFCHVRYYEKNKELIDRIISLSGLELMLSNEKTGDKYPFDVLFNACLLGDGLICNKKTVSKLILDAAQAHGREIIDVPQGYTKCSICPVGENAIITADKAIAKTCKASGIDVLHISEGHIFLPPYDYGFIGGAGGLCGNTVYFCGSVDLHPDGERIKKFCTENGAEFVSLSNERLQDVGTIFFI